MNKHGTLVRAFAILMAVGLIAGVAWAASEEVSTPCGNNFTVTGELQPGVGGLDMFASNGAGMEDDEIDLSIGVDGGGMLEICGTPMGACDLNNEHKVEVRVKKQGNKWLADIRVYDVDHNCKVAELLDHDMGGKPSHVAAQADDVYSLTAE